MRAIINADGSVEPGPIVLNGNPYLASLAVLALEAVRHWRYAPTLVDGEPVEVETTVTVTFPAAQ
jgi:protein TonB